MKDEEMAEEYFESECLHSYADTEEELKEDVVAAFLAGLKAGRPQWHKVSEHDYPDTSRIVLCRNRNGLYFIACNKIDNSWEILIGTNVNKVNEYLECQWFVDEWAEIPL